jgi:hypothetical protein
VLIGVEKTGVDARILMQQHRALRTIRRCDEPQATALLFV